MDILCVGHAAWDISVMLDDYPAENSKGETRTLLECGGGPAANAACLIASWDASCALATTVGADEYADRVLGELVRAKVDVSLVHRSQLDSTPVSVILVNESTASRTIINRNLRGVSPCRISARPVWPESPKALLFDGHELSASLDAMALFPDARTILDGGSVRRGTLELAHRVDHLVVSEKFARQFSGLPDIATDERQETAVRALHKLNGHPVVITLGERGLVYGTDSRVQRMNAFQVESVDTTAAGDLFHGAFAFGILKDMPMDATLRLASAAAALSTTRHGGRTSIPTLTEVETLLGRAK